MSGEVEVSRDCFNWCVIIHSNKLFKCSGCKIAVYCSKLCQKEHWYRSHKKDCKFLNGTSKLPDECFHDDNDCEDCKKEPGSELVKGCPYRNMKGSTEFYRRNLFHQLLEHTHTITTKLIFKSNFSSV